MDARCYHDLRRMARRLTGDAAQADDLVQDTMLAGVLAGRDDPAWLAGVLRRQAVFAMRSAVRRRRREFVGGATMLGVDDAGGGYMQSVEEKVAWLAQVDDTSLIQAWLRQRPRSLRHVATLLLHGLTSDELRWLLRVSPAAFRQRLTGLRRAVAAAPSPVRSALAERVRHPPPRAGALPWGLLRRGLKAAMADAPALGTHDPDGHLLLVRAPAHTGALVGN